MAAELTARLGAAELVWSRVSREPNATVAVRPGHGVERRGTGRPTAPNVVRAGAWTRHRLAGDDGGRRSQRTCRGAYDHAMRAGASMTAVQELTALDRAIDAGDEAPARAPAPGRLVGRRARVERDDDRRAPLLAPLPGPARPADRPEARERAARPPPRRRHLVELVRGAGRPLDDDRVVRRAEDGRRRRRARRRATTSAARAGSRERASSRSASSRCSASGRGSGSRRCRWRSCCSRRGAVLDLQPRLLGAADGRPALRRHGAPAGPAERRRPARDRRAPGPDEAARPAGAAPAPRDRGAERWVRARQEADGGWGGIQPPWVWSIIMLASLGYGFEDEHAPARRRGVGRLPVDEGDRLRPEACQSPVWDTGARGARRSATRASRPTTRSSPAPASGCSPRRSASRATGRSACPDVAPGGWAFEFANDLYPDVDDAAVVALALRELGARARRRRRRGLEWIAGMQSSNGGWGAFDVDNTSDWLYRIPFFDFGAVIDPPSEDVDRARRSRRSRP